MPEDVVETIEMSKFKDLQRKNDRLQKSTKQITEQFEGMRASQERTEAVLEGLVQLMGQDETLKAAADQLLSGNSTRRAADDTSGKLTARLQSTLDSADADWDEERFNDARKVYNEINESGDLSRAFELESLLSKAIEPLDESFNDRVAEEVERVLHGQSIDTKRVDTGSSTVRSSPMSRQDLSRMNPHEGRDALKAANKAFLDQLGT